MNPIRAPKKMEKGKFCENLYSTNLYHSIQRKSARCSEGQHIRDLDESQGENGLIGTAHKKNKIERSPDGTQFF